MADAASLPTQTFAYDDDTIAAAARLIASGSIVAVPTETVYGLAADATSEMAVAAIYAAKGRPAFNPLIVHVADAATAFEIGSFGPAEQALAAAHWPGPLTIVVPLLSGSGIARGATAGLTTVALRVPAHRAMQALLRATGRPLAAPSANASGAISPTRAAHVLHSLGGRIPMIIDDGPTTGGLESTIVAIEDGALRVLRPGSLVFAEANDGTGSALVAPGQLAAHYAPSKPVRLGVVHAGAEDWHIGFGSVAGDFNLSAAGDLREAGACLFDALHVADAASRRAIAVAPVPETGIGIAINDRLRRASAGSQADRAA